jgi:cobaltochelatase CobN
MAWCAVYFPNRPRSHRTRREPMRADATHPLATKRLVIGHLTVCQGCCCGNTENGRPPVPVDWLKKEWRARGLLKRVQLTISGCLGPCDLPNVVTISNENGTQWFGEIQNSSNTGISLTGRLVPGMQANCCPFQENFQRHTLHPFRKRDSRAER